LEPIQRGSGTDALWPRLVDKTALVCARANTALEIN
jgi:hypothetical protein